MGVGVTIKVMSGGVLHSILVMGILKGVRTHVMMKTRTHLVFLLVIHEGSNGTTLRGTVPSLTTNMDNSPSNPKHVD